ncbi:MAG: hypothetical protein IBJ18_12160 [Phycisphaerales bacterium]|nr:hypothetical protein [Phycisphaerales bacterium]
MASTADSTPGTPRFPPPPMPIDDEHAQAFDALADLFLGPSTPDPLASTPPDIIEEPLPTPTEPTDQPAAPIAQPTATLRLKRDEDHHHDQHTDLAEHNEPRDHQPDPLSSTEASPTPQIEVILQAPLPGLASSWVQPHARASASTQGQLTLVRAGRSSCRVDRLHIRASSPSRPQPTTPHTDLRQALHSARSATSRTVIAPSEGDEHAILLSPACTHITLICGCDQSSIVGAYRRLKRLAELFTSTNNNTSTTPSTPEIRILFVGSDEHTAKAAFARLSDAAGSFLRMPLAMLAPVHRLSPAGNVLADTLYDGPLSIELTEALPILAANTPTQPPPTPARPRAITPPISPRTRRLLTDEELAGLIEFIPSTPSSSSSSNSANNTHSSLRDDTTPILDAAAEAIHAEFDLDFDVEDTADLDQPPASPSSQPITDRANKPAPASSPAASFAAPSTSPAPATNLAALIAGLSPLQARCPFTPAVQLALDTQGRLHLLSSEPLPQAVSDLEVASAWATAHRDLLALTPGCQALTTSSTAATPPLRHWFTPDAKAAKHMLDANLRVHLLLTITTPGLHACAMN